MNRLDELFKKRNKNLLNIFTTAGYPSLNSTKEVILSLQKNGADMIEIGMPYSDPIADGPVIQQSNLIALQNGMNMQLLFEQLKSIKEKELDKIIPSLKQPFLGTCVGMQLLCNYSEESDTDCLGIFNIPKFLYH